MNRGEDCHAPLSFFLQDIHYSKGSGGIKSTCWFVKQQQRRLSNQLIAYRCPLSFAPGDPSFHEATNLLIFTSLKTKSLNNGMHSLLDLLWVQCGSNLAGKLKKFPW